MGPDERARSVAGEVNRGVLPARSTHLVNEVVSAAAGISQQYTGSPDGDANRHRGIPEAESASFIKEVHQKEVHQVACPGSGAPGQAELDATA